MASKVYSTLRARQMTHAAQAIFPLPGSLGLASLNLPTGAIGWIEMGVLPVQLDLGHLAMFDLNAIDEAALKTPSSREPYLLLQATENLQQLINSLFSIPSQPSEDGPMIPLPNPTTVLPRSKPAPKVKPKTRWEQFADARGIKKRKRGAFAYDEERQEWRPRHGAKSAKNDPMADWVVELKPGQSIEELN